MFNESKSDFFLLVVQRHMKYVLSVIKISQFMFKLFANLFEEQRSSFNIFLFCQNVIFEAVHFIRNPIPNFLSYFRCRTLLLLGAVSWFD